MGRFTMCSCDACTHIDQLSLKVIVHHGEAIPSPDGDDRPFRAAGLGGGDSVADAAVFPRGHGIGFLPRLVGHFINTCVYL